MFDVSTNPLTRVRDAVWNPTAASVRFLALLGVIVNAGIIFSGGAVRLTKSGLGCPTWPKCTGDSLLPTSSPEHSPVNMAIEFTNRTLTFLVLAVAVAVFIAALRLRPRRRDIVRLARLQPLGVAAQAGWGGVTVLTELNPAVVAFHYMLSTAMIFVAFLLYVRAGEGDGPLQRLVAPRVRSLTHALTGVTVVLLAAGTVVTGAGPHAGDDTAERFPFAIDEVSKIHALFAWLTVALTIALFFLARRTGAPEAVRKAIVVLFAVEMGQGLIGYVQYFTGVPAVLVGLHMLGSALLWIAVLRVVFAERVRADAGAAEAVEARTRTVPTG
jgi:heme a synthase